MRFKALVLLLAASVAAQAEYLSTSLVRGDQTLALNGIGTVRQLNLDMYHIALYTSQLSSSPEGLLDARQRRVLHLRVTADRMFATGTARHFRELIHVNNSRDDIQREGDNLNQFYKVFQHGLAQGDEVIFDGSDGQSTKVSINGSTILRIRSPLFFNMLLRCYIGPRPPGLALRNELLAIETANIGNRLAEMNGLAVQKNREDIYKNVKIAAATSEPVVEKPAPAPEATVTKPEPKVAEVKKPEPVPEKPVSEKPSSEKKAKVEPEEAPVTVVAKTEPASEKRREPEPVVTAPLAKAEPFKPKLSDTDIAELLANYQLALQDRLQNALEYPRRELKQKYGLTQLARAKGNVILKLNLDRSGDINAIWFISKSPDAILDEAAMSLVDKQAPFPPLPDNLPEPAYEFFVELSFSPD